MTVDLQDTFIEYLELLTSQRPTVDTAESGLRLAANRDREFRSIVERVEEGQFFRRLVRETKTRFQTGTEHLHEDWWESFVQNILRRTSIYIAVLAGRSIDERMFRQFCDALAPEETTTTTIAPLEYIQLSKARLDFEAFRVQRFSSIELADLVENRVREVFFPDAVFNVDLLSQYWWLVVTQAHRPSDSRRDPLRIELPRPVARRFSSFPSVLTDPLKCLVLCDWEGSLAPPSDPAARYAVDHYRNMAGWSGFTIPFTVSTGGSLRLPLQPPPDQSVLAMDPVHDHDGSEVGERPAQGMWLDAAETDSFEREVAQFERQLRGARVAEKRWTFVDVALGYLLKAFFADDLDQLLWHIAALEALFGETADKLTETLAQRCKRVLGRTKQDREIIAISFRRLYGLRSDTVHGNTDDAKAHSGHLAVARYMARDCIAWFLSYLSLVAQSYQPIEDGYPKRTELITAIDHTPSERTRLSALLQTLPADFPSLPRPEVDGQQGNAANGPQRGS